MNIKEVEQRTSMTRANIRFYEEEGLICPVRNENGYRDYAEDDVLKLKQIRLFRNMKLSLNDIKEIFNGNKSLHETMEKHLITLTEKQIEYHQYKNLCQEIYSQNIEIDDFNPDVYISNMNNDEMIHDVIKEEVIPFRRYFARVLDVMIYDTILYIIIQGMFKIEIQDIKEVWLIAISTLLMMLFIEPLLLAKFKTTCGKAIMGITVTSYTNQNLSYGDAFSRTWKVIVKGMGFQIPIVEQVRMYKCYKDYTQGKLLDWEDCSVLHHKELKWYKYIVFVCVYLLFVYMRIVSSNSLTIVENKAPLTIEAFKENYSFYNSYYNYDDPLYIYTGVKRADLNYEVENGEVVEVWFEEEYRDCDSYPPSHIEDMIVVANSMIKADPKYTMITFKMDTIIEDMSRNIYTDLEYDILGYKIICDVEYENYKYGIEYPTKGLWKTSDKNYYKIKYSVKKVSC